MFGSVSLCDLYGRGVCLAKAVFRIQTVDILEEALVAGISGAAFQSLPTFYSGFSGVGILGALGAAAVGLLLHDRYVKAPYVEKQICKIVQHSQSKGHRRKALFIHTKPENDWNGCFTSLHTCAERYRKAAELHAIDRIRGLGPEEKGKLAQLDETRKETQRYDVIDVIAHGSSDRVATDKGQAITKNRMKSGLRTLGVRVKEKGKIILESCSAAYGDDNIAKAISNAAKQAHVFASSAIFWPLYGCDFQSDMTPTFTNGIFTKGERTTRAYFDGKEVTL